MPRPVGAAFRRARAAAASATTSSVQRPATIQSLVSAVAALALAAPGAGCRDRERSALARALEPAVASALATPGPAATVTCTTGEPPSCQVQLGGGAAAPLTLSDDGAQVRWQLGAAVVALAPLEQHLSRELAALGWSARPRCGAPLLVLEGPHRLECSLGDLGVAWVSFAADGSYTYEVALGAAAAARRDGPPSQSLDELSRALDRDQGQPDDDDDGEADGEPDGEADRAAPGTSAPPAGAAAPPRRGEPRRGSRAGSGATSSLAPPTARWRGAARRPPRRVAERARR